MRVTEEYIKSVLDGTFTRIGENNVVRTEVHNGEVVYDAGEGGRPRGAKVVQSLWTPDEDDLLCAMRLRNRPFSEIAWLVGRSEDAAKRRYKALRVNGMVRV